MAFVRFNSISRETTPDKVAGIKVMAPISGEVTLLSAALSGGQLEGVSIKPSSHFVIAPFSGRVLDITPSHGQIIIQANNKVQFAIQLPEQYNQHLGEGLKIKVARGDSIEAGQDLMELDLYKIQHHLKPIALQFLLLDSRPFSRVLVPHKNVEAGKDIIFSLIPRPKKQDTQ